jgi:hypothetical protein
VCDLICYLLVCRSTLSCPLLALSLPCVVSGSISIPTQSNNTQETTEVRCDALRRSKVLWFLSSPRVLAWLQCSLNDAERPRIVIVLHLFFSRAPSSIPHLLLLLSTLLSLIWLLRFPIYPYTSADFHYVPTESITVNQIYTVAIVLTASLSDCVQSAGMSACWGKWIR